MDKEQSVPKYFRCKTPLIGSEELNAFYDYAFGVLHASWMGKVGHYPFGEGSEIAEHQDGYIYFVFDEHTRRIHQMTACCRTAHGLKPTNQSWQTLHLTEKGPIFKIQNSSASGARIPRQALHATMLGIKDT